VRDRKNLIPVVFAQRIFLPYGDMLIMAGENHSVKRVPLAAAMKASLAMSPVVIVQGAMVWPLVQGIVEEIGAARVRRVYLKRMKWSNPDRWHDGSQFLEAAAPRHLGEYSNSIDRYHRDHQPWRGADLILERIEAEGEDDQ
jgi:hypothetical protein